MIETLFEDNTVIITRNVTGEVIIKNRYREHEVVVNIDSSRTIVKCNGGFGWFDKVYVNGRDTEHLNLFIKR